MAIFEIPVFVRIEADSAEEGTEKVLSFMEYAQEVGNDSGEVKNCYIGLPGEAKQVE